MVERKPGNLIAAWWNIIICGAIVVIATIYGVTTNGFGFIVALVGVGMEIFFVRILFQILKERREEQP